MTPKKIRGAVAESASITTKQHVVIDDINSGHQKIITKNIGGGEVQSRPGNIERRVLMIFIRS